MLPMPSQIRNDPVAEWLGFGFDPPAGLDGEDRERIVTAHTRQTEEAGGIGVIAALAKAFPLDQAARVATILAPRALDDALWRDVHELLRLGGPVLFYELRLMLRTLTLGTDEERGADAARLRADWQLAAEAAATRH